MWAGKVYSEEKKYYWLEGRDTSIFLKERVKRRLWKVFDKCCGSCRGVGDPVAVIYCGDCNNGLYTRAVAVNFNQQPHDLHVKMGSTFST
jgi:hypothetical protein